ncbi:MAG: hypothetical protein FJ040_13350 [Chloroflexi bacterium]|nr:hypothetical protein [Chloroflexota bacterium]
MKAIDWFFAVVVGALSVFTASIVMKDQFAIYDQGLLLISVAWIIVNWAMTRNPSLIALIPGHSWLIQYGIKSPALFTAGVGIVLLVALRHAIQIRLLFVNYYMHPESEQLLSRYASRFWCCGSSGGAHFYSRFGHQFRISEYGETIVASCCCRVVYSALPLCFVFIIWG